MRYSKREKTLAVLIAAATHLLALAFGVHFGSKVGENRGRSAETSVSRQDAIKNGFACYSGDTGEWRWKTMGELSFLRLMDTPEALAAKPADIVQPVNESTKKAK